MPGVGTQGSHRWCQLPPSYFNPISLQVHKLIKTRVLQHGDWIEGSKMLALFQNQIWKQPERGWTERYGWFAARTVFCLPLELGRDPCTPEQDAATDQGSAWLVVRCFLPRLRTTGGGAPGWSVGWASDKAQVMILWFVGSSPASGSVLTAQSSEPASDSGSPSLAAPLPVIPSLSLSLSLCLSK